MKFHKLTNISHWQERWRQEVVCTNEFSDTMNTQSLNDKQTLIISMHEFSHKHWYSLINCNIIHLFKTNDMEVKIFINLKGLSRISYYVTCRPCSPAESCVLKDQGVQGWAASLLQAMSETGWTESDETEIKDGRQATK